VLDVQLEPDTSAFAGQDRESASSWNGEHSRNAKALELNREHSESTDQGRGIAL